MLSRGGPFWRTWTSWYQQLQPSWSPLPPLSWFAFWLEGRIRTNKVSPCLFQNNRFLTTYKRFALNRLQTESFSIKFQWVEQLWSVVTCAMSSTTFRLRTESCRLFLDLNTTRAIVLNAVRLFDSSISASFTSFLLWVSDARPRWHWQLAELRRDCLYTFDILPLLSRLSSIRSQCFNKNLNSSKTNLEPSSPIHPSQFPVTNLLPWSVLFPISFFYSCVTFIVCFFVY